MEYKTIMWAKMKPDIYSGPNCSEHLPRFECFADGDMSSDYSSDFTLKASQFPPGTKITVEVPCCPECAQEADLCKEDERCDFDWRNWTECEYG